MDVPLLQRIPMVPLILLHSALDLSSTETFLVAGAAAEEAMASVVSEENLYPSQ